ncbi:MAG: 30S ribosomal protein S16 [Spirochaetales bacterium]|nr:30S ribosomal protein S16 [Spirochaetales bacterium]MBQ6124875.1 30S ribosomal protein S16 [Spirochaetales bacterium]MBQ7281472.1 30S ribosomal protein S16 [Spirochaetales bacterium]MBQ7730104.1 30S ribosomal protein S16 [Spirochaetales bacterium]
MSVSIRLKRFGTKKRPYYRVVVIDSRLSDSGRPLEEIGYFHPIEAEENQVKIDAERASYWLQNGAQPSDTVKAIFAKQGIQTTKAPAKD